MKVYNYTFIVTENYLDNYGHVNNARYMDLYEMARWDVFKQSSAGKELLNQKTYGIIILEANIRFRQELLPGFNINIETRFIDPAKRIFEIFQEMKDRDKQVYSTAKFKAGIFDLKCRKLIRGNDLWVKALEG